MKNAFSQQKRKISLFSRLRTNFLTGLIVITPIALTAWLIWSVIGWIDGFVLPLIPDQYEPDILLYNWLYFGKENAPPAPTSVRGIGVVVFLIFTLVVGWIAKGFIGRSLLRWAEALVESVPVVRSIYSGVKQIAETVLNRTDRSFEQACMIEYPRKGIWAIGFISTEAKGEIADIQNDLVSVFVPTTPNPTSGFLLFFPKKDIHILDMSVEQAAKLVISAGLVYPSDIPNKKQI